MTYRLVERQPGVVPADFDRDSLFEGDAHSRAQLIYDWCDSPRRYFTIENVVEIEGWCPFLTCLEPVPHTHPICNSCGAVRHGNMFCSECRSHWPAHWRIPSLP